MAFQIDGSHARHLATVRCPAHDDATPSLVVMVDEDLHLHLFCLAGCSPAAVAISLHSLPARNRLKGIIKEAAM
jgi:hypothetical protein